MVNLAYKLFNLLFTVEVAKNPSSKYCSNIINTLSLEDKMKLGKGKKKKVKTVIYTPQNRHIEVTKMQIFPKVYKLVSCRTFSKTVNRLLVS